jgi:phage FluMu protein Com
LYDTDIDNIRDRVLFVGEEMSAKEYIRTPEMMGTKPIRCYNCNQMLIRHFIANTFEIGLTCRICKVIIYIRCKEAIPAAVSLKDEWEELSEKADVLSLQVSVGKNGVPSI